MKNNKVTISEAVKKFGKRNIITTIMVILFFVLLIMVYFVMLYSSKTENLMYKGELNAKEYAEKFDHCIYTGENILRAAEHTLGSIMANDNTPTEIQKYVVRMSGSITTAVAQDHTGVFGYIQGRYYEGFSAANEGENPTKQKWYQKGIEGGGDPIVVESYVDMQTGSMLLTMAKALSDKKSVVAIKLELDVIRDLTEMKDLKNQGAKEMIVDDDGVIMIHSDKDKIGKSVYDAGTLEAAAWDKLTLGNVKNTVFKYRNTEYVASTALLENGWCSVSMIDATGVCMPLMFLLATTVVVVLLTVLILLLIILNAIKKSFIADRLNVQLASTADIYISVHDIDIINDTFEEIRVTRKKISDILGVGFTGAQENLYRTMDALVDKSSKESIFKFINLKTLDERLSQTNTISEEFYGSRKVWCRGRFIVAERTPEGELSHVLWLVEDIDKEKRRRDELLDMSERAMAASEAKSAFLSSMSHEIRTPINAILGMNEMVLRECDDEEITSYSESIKTAGNTLLGIINDILDFSKIESGKMDIIPVDYDLASVLNDLVNMVQIRAELKGLKLNLDFDKSTPKILNGDEVRIKQIITNILTNAVKYTHKGSVTFSLHHEKIKDAPDYIMLCVSVEDTGIGIRQQDIPTLFKEFRRIEEDRNRSIEGTGLGMNITHGLLTMMGSSLNVKSIYGRGSVFSFELRQKVVKWDPVGDYQAAYKDAITNHSKYTEKLLAPEAEILVTDDTPMNLLVMKNLLKQTRIHIDTAESGNECIRAAVKKKYDIIFLDHMMPHKDGIETVKELKAIKDYPNADTPIICLTANAVSGAREMYLEAGFDDYLTKPIDFFKLEEMLFSYLPKDKVNMASGAKYEAEEDEGSRLPEFLTGISEINISEGIRNCGSADGFIEALKTYSGMVFSHISEIEKYWKHGDIKNTTVKIHALKSTSKIIGAQKISILAQMLEDAGNQHDDDTIEAYIYELTERCRILGTQLRPLSEGEEKREELPLIETERLKEAYTLIAEFASVGDYDSVTQIAADLDKYRMPDNETERAERLRNAIENLDYDLIPAILSQ